MERRSTPLNVQTNIFACDYDGQSNLEMVYQAVRQWVHGPYQEAITAEDGTEVEVPIDFSYLAALSAEERTVVSKAERSFFENLCADNCYVNDVTKVLAEYLSPTELLEMVVYAFLEEMYVPDNITGVNTVDRYYVMYNALMSKADTLIVEMMNGLRKDYTFDINGDLPASKYTELAVAMFESNTAAVENHMDDFVELVQWLKGKLDDSVDLRRFGDKDLSDHRSLLFDVLRDLLNIGRQLPSRYLNWFPFWKTCLMFVI